MSTEAAPAHPSGVPDALQRLKDTLVKATGRHPFASGATPCTLRTIRRLAPALPGDVEEYLVLHDGTSPTSRVLATWMIGPWLPLSAAHSEAVYRDRALLWQRDSGEELRTQDGLDWFPVFRSANGVLLAVDCSSKPSQSRRDEGDLVMIHRFMPSPAPVPGLAALLSFFADAVESGAWRWQADRSRWISDHTIEKHDSRSSLL